MTQSNNAPLTNQGRADLRRSPTQAQIAFNDSRRSSISVLKADFLRYIPPRGPEGVGAWQYGPYVEPVSIDATGTRVCAFVWMTDRVLSAEFTQIYPGLIRSNAGGSVVGRNLRVSGYDAWPTTNLPDLPSPATCTSVTVPDIGAQSILAYPPASLAIAGTALVLQLVDNDYSVQFTGESTCNLSLRVDSESLQSGYTTGHLGASSTFDPYTDVVLRRQNVIVPASAYFGLGLYTTNTLSTQLGLSGPVYDFNVAGIYTVPPEPTPR